MGNYPLHVEAHHDERLSRWLWLVKWLLLIPHYLVLAVLGTGSVVLTVVAYLAVLVTGRYPPAIRAYNLGVLRWGWRVAYYGYQALGTDRYPPFTLADVPEHPARVHLSAEDQPPRWLPLVAWLLAVPHLMILSLLYGAARRQHVPLSFLGLLVLFCGVAVLFTGRYPGGLHDLLVGIGRWNLRVIGYLMLITHRYPPFRLDQGGSEPEPPPVAPDRLETPHTAGRASAAGPVAALVTGVLLLAPGVGLGVVGSGLLTLESQRDSAGYVTGPSVRLSSATAAVTAENLTITDAALWGRDVTDIGALRITATDAAGAPLFVGIGPQSAVDDWLAGTAHDEFADLNDGTAGYDRAGGVVRAVADPAAQPFWLASTAAPGTATIEWTAVRGDFAVVVANADGSPGVTANVRGAVQLSDLSGLGGGLLAAGLLLTAVAIALITLGGIGLGRRHGGPPPPVQPPPVQPPAGSPPQAPPLSAGR
ncbi:DUF4389 domain-containing protein [Actinoplanes sp. N902-109]|uniref:DUF4389 domain-containing protein n=1 Tax=Actinoplanes sp. (strain N902-109) TaxID=649831 RepID=UPI0003294029|nr:DUF4389 domain-containing protein [Actinoplanes sp. N902-109]AGL16941.1 hypothetical protein L083_3431 [Actinoplanes sp. N902-109]